MGAEDQAYTAWKIPKNTKATMAFPQMGWIKIRSNDVVLRLSSCQGNCGPSFFGNSFGVHLRMDSIRHPASSNCSAAGDASTSSRASDTAAFPRASSQSGTERERKYHAARVEGRSGNTPSRISNAVFQSVGASRGSECVPMEGCMSKIADSSASVRSRSKFN